MTTSAPISVDRYNLGRHPLSHLGLSRRLANIKRFFCSGPRWLRSTKEPSAQSYLASQRLESLRNGLSSFPAPYLGSDGVKKLGSRFDTPKPNVFVIVPPPVTNLIEETVAKHEHNVIARNDAAILSQPFVHTVQSKILAYVDSMNPYGVSVEHMCDNIPDHSRSSISSRVSELVKSGQMRVKARYLNSAGNRVNYYTTVEAD